MQEVNKKIDPASSIEIKTVFVMVVAHLKVKRLGIVIISELVKDIKADELNLVAGTFAAMARTSFLRPSSPLH